METQVQLIPFGSTKEEVEQKFPIVRSELKALAEQCKVLTIIGVDDKAGMRAVDAARKELKAKRTLIRATGKDARDAATKYAKAIIALEDSLVEEVEPEERRLEKRYDEVQEEIEKIAVQKQKDEDDRIQGLLNQLRQVESDMDIYELKAITPERFASVLAEATQVFNENQILRAEQKRQQEEELKKKKEEEEIARLKFEDDQKKWREDQAQLEAEKRKFENEKRKLEEDQAALRNQRFKVRSEILRPFYYEGGASVDGLESMTEAEFQRVVVLWKGKHAEWQAAIKQKALEEEEKRLRDLKYEDIQKIKRGDDKSRFEYLVGQIESLQNDQVFKDMKSAEGKTRIDFVFVLLGKVRLACLGFIQPLGSITPKND